jgi:predicted transcriptional regulator
METIIIGIILFGIIWHLVISGIAGHVAYTKGYSSLVWFLLTLLLLDIIGLIIILCLPKKKENQELFINVNSLTTGSASINDNSQQKTSKFSAEKEILILAGKVPTLTLRDIIVNTNLEMEEAENILNKLVSKGIANEQKDSSGKSIFLFEKPENDYMILGVTKNTSINNIKKAYRKLAIRYHPYKNPGNEEAAKMFKKVTDAFERIIYNY